MYVSDVDVDEDKRGGQSEAFLLLLSNPSNPSFASSSLCTEEAFSLSLLIEEAFIDEDA